MTTQANQEVAFLSKIDRPTENRERYGVVFHLPGGDTWTNWWYHDYLRDQEYNRAVERHLAFNAELTRTRASLDGSSIGWMERFVQESKRIRGWFESPVVLRGDSNPTHAGTEARPVSATRSAAKPKALEEMGGTYADAINNAVSK